MSYKQYVPSTSQDWDTYWTQTSIQAEYQKAQTDGLKPIFKKYLKKTAINLEAGCGLGKWLTYLGRQRYSIIGLDTYVKGLVQLHRHNPDFQLMAGDVNHLGILSGSIDTYISLGVVEHFESGPQPALQEAFRVTKKGGLAIIEVPFDSPLRRLDRFLYRLKVLFKLPVKLLVETLGLRQPRPQTSYVFYEYRYTQKELIGFIQAAGFELIELLPKDDLDPQRSISLWSDYPRFRRSQTEVFNLNSSGRLAKRLLHSLSPFSYPALIVAICTKP